MEIAFFSQSYTDKQVKDLSTCNAHFYDMLVSAIDGKNFCTSAQRVRLLEDINALTASFICLEAHWLFAVAALQIHPSNFKCQFLAYC
jgi:hypothetical protein